MARLVYLSSARGDLLGIFDTIAQGSGSAGVARGFVERLRARCRRLAELPGTLGTARPELMPGIRSTPMGDYVIFFRYAPGRVEIVNVLHGGRDLARAIASGV